MAGNFEKGVKSNRKFTFHVKRQAIFNNRILSQTMFVWHINYKFIYFIRSLKFPYSISKLKRGRQISIYCFIEYMLFHYNLQVQDSINLVIIIGLWPKWYQSCLSKLPKLWNDFFKIHQKKLWSWNYCLQKFIYIFIFVLIWKLIF